MSKIYVFGQGMAVYLAYSDSAVIVWCVIPLRNIHHLLNIDFVFQFQAAISQNLSLSNKVDFPAINRPTQWSPPETDNKEMVFVEKVAKGGCRVTRSDSDNSLWIWPFPSRWSHACRDKPQSCKVQPGSIEFSVLAELWCTTHQICVVCYYRNCVAWLIFLLRFCC